MSEPSDEIMERALRVCIEAVHPYQPGDISAHIDVPVIARALAEAIAAEREECAKVADSRAYAHWKPVIGRRTDEQVELDAALREEADEIASAIRARGK